MLWELTDLKCFTVIFLKLCIQIQAEKKKHLTFEDNEYGPDFEPLMEIIAKKNLSPVFICESSGTQAEDALKMKENYLSYK